MPEQESKPTPITAEEYQAAINWIGRAARRGQAAFPLERKFPNAVWQVLKYEEDGWFITAGPFETRMEATNIARLPLSRDHRRYPQFSVTNGIGEIMARTGPIQDFKDAVVEYELQASGYDIAQGPPRLPSSMVAIRKTTNEHEYVAGDSPYSPGFGLVDGEDREGDCAEWTAKILRGLAFDPPDTWDVETIRDTMLWPKP